MSSDGSAAFAGRRGYWLRQLSDCAEPDVAGLLQTITQYGGTKPALYAKCMDGVTWQGQTDLKTPLASVMDTQRLLTDCANAGVAFSPVVVPRGGKAEVALHAQLAYACGSLLVDIEEGPGFYDRGPTDQIPAYFYMLRDSAPDAWIVAQPDPRNLDSVLFDQWVQYVDGISAQHYVGWTGVGWTDVVAEVNRFDVIRDNGKPCYPTLFGTGDAPTVETFWRAVRDYSEGLQFFALGSMGPVDFAMASRLKLPGEAV